MSHPAGRGDRRKKDRDGPNPKVEVRSDKGPPKAKPRPGGDTVAPSEEPTSKYMHNRTLYAIMNFIGRVVQVQVKSGAIFEGIFHTANTDKGLGIVLKMAKKKDTPITVPPIPTLVIQSKDFVQLIVKDVTFDIDEPEQFGDEGVFHTDTDISGHSGDVRERELLPWAPDEDEATMGLSNTFESGKRGWDQFAVNEQLFGVKTSYQEELYTTALDRNSRFYAERAEEARRIAAEIEGKSAGGNIHLAEERGQAETGAEEIDEEDRYSSVIRTDKYVPPAKRTAKDSKERDIKQGTKDSPPRLESERSSSSLSSSTEDLGSVSPGKDKYSNERIRLRLNIVKEQYKNTAPVTTTSDPAPAEVPRSPLHSPLVGNPKAINALSLEPCSPKLPEEVVRDFLEFSLGEKAKRESLQKQKSRESVTEQFKNFSRELDKRSSRPGSPLTMSPSPSPLSGSASNLPTQETISNTISQLAQTSSNSPSSATGAATAAPSTTPATTTPPKPMTSKLNPNAKVFTPMSANAPVFTPKSFTPQPAIIPAEPVYFPLMNVGMEPPRNAPDFSESVGDVYCESIKRKHQHNPESAKTTVPYWMGPRGSYRNIAEEEANYFYAQHPMAGPAPRHPAMVGMAPVAGMGPMSPVVPGINPMAMNMVPPGAVAGFPPQYVGVIPAGAPIPIPAQGQPVGPLPPGATPIYTVPHQPGVRPFQPMQPVAAPPMQPSYVYTPGVPAGMPPHTPPGPHHGQYQPPGYPPQQIPHSPHSPQTPPMGVQPQKRYYTHMSPQQQPILMPHSPSHPGQVYASPPPNTAPTPTTPTNPNTTSPSRPNIAPTPGGTPPNRT